MLKAPVEWMKKMTHEEQSCKNVLNELENWKYAIAL